MCVVFTIHFACGCDQQGKAASNGCSGNCSGDNVRYDENLDRDANMKCEEHQYVSPPTSSEESASDTSAETSSEETVAA